MYLVYELMDTNLHRIIRSKQPLHDEHHQFFIYQACATTCALHPEPYSIVTSKQPLHDSHHQFFLSTGPAQSTLQPLYSYTSNLTP